MCSQGFETFREEKVFVVVYSFMGSQCWEYDMIYMYLEELLWPKWKSLSCLFIKYIFILLICFFFYVLDRFLAETDGDV
jgi:hypothetical protein